MMKPNKIALIGGAGFIVHNLAISLKNRGHEVVIIDIYYHQSRLTLHLAVRLKNFYL